MKKRYIFAVLLALVLSILTGVIANASTYEGCTPGYWKQRHHFDSWVGYSPGDYFDDVFGVGPHITLHQALRARGGGVNAYMRHVVAALLNATSGIAFGYKPDQILLWGAAGYDHRMMKDIKNMFAGWNETGCPLD